MRRDYDAEGRLLSQSWGSRHKILESKCAELEADLNELNEKIHQRQIALIHLKEQKDRVAQELNSKLNNGMSAQVGLMRRNLESKIKMHETAKQMLSKKIEELSEELKAEEKKCSTVEAKFENDNNVLRQEISSFRKDHSANISDYEAIQKNAAIVNSTIEVISWQNDRGVRQRIEG
eukprot:TRINITY_DN2794_c0_g1_i12.p3 TRINITY_DN2794_c0_g1~~TRINITY_DN2794_c0_g1_i12.p3  ORF type:complete len:177 (-),score=68.06 TRINITY_DN2794_c0_g1_i12:412-942(-)